jgi:outer membrane protein assembly factor BamB
LYAATASYCDFPNWQGRISAINTATASLGASFFPSSTAYGASGLGGGIWGPVSAAIDPASNDVFIATGNDWTGPSEHAGYGEQVVRLNAALTSVLAANYPGTTGQDSDFGSTPMLFTPPGCPAMVAAKNKDGDFVQWTRDGINSGAIANIEMAPPDPTGGNFIGLTAYSPVTHDVYVGDYANDGVYAAGVDALAATGPNCTLQLKWKTPLPVGSSNTQAVPVSPPATANGVVYFGSGLAHTLYALDATTGAQLWNSGGTITGPLFAAPVIDGILLVGSWDHKLYAFGVQ